MHNFNLPVGTKSVFCFLLVDSKRKETEGNIFSVLTKQVDADLITLLLLEAKQTAHNSHIKHYCQSMFYCLPCSLQWHHITFCSTIKEAFLNGLILLDGYYVHDKQI